MNNEYAQLLIAEINPIIKDLIEFMQERGYMTGRGLSALLATGGSTMLHFASGSSVPSPSEKKSFDICMAEIDREPLVAAHLLLQVSKIILQAQHIIDCNDNKGE